MDYFSDEQFGSVTFKEIVMTSTKTTSKKSVTSNNTKAPTNSIRFRVTTKLQANIEIYEAVAEIPGFKPTKVTRQDGNTAFTTRSSLTKACRDRATSLKRVPIFDFGNLSTATKTKITQKFSGKVPVAKIQAGVCPVTGATS